MIKIKKIINIKMLTMRSEDMAEKMKQIIKKDKIRKILNNNEFIVITLIISWII